MTATSPANNESNEGVESVDGKKDKHRKLAGGDSTTRVSSGSNDGVEKINGNMGKQKQLTDGK